MSVFSRVAGVAFTIVALIAGAAPGNTPEIGTAAAPAHQALSQPEVLQGPQPFLTVLCKLGGVTAEPEPAAYFDDLVGAPVDGLNVYWKEVSFGRINLDGSAVVSWRQLPEDADFYRDTNAEIDLERLAAGCIVQGQAGHDLSSFAGLSLVFNADLDSRPRAGRTCIDGAGGRECFTVIWMWPAWLHSQAAWAHEMGHVFGLPHSSDPSGGDYANVWDVMSGFAGCSCGKGHNSIPQHPIAYQLDRLGWIGETRRYVLGADEEARVHLERTALPSADGTLIALVPTRSADRYYTVEARGRAGFDAHTPGAAVLIHEVDRTRPERPARLVLKSAEQPVTVASGMWKPGDCFVNRQDRVSITIEAETASGFDVLIRTGARTARGGSVRARAEEKAPAVAELRGVTPVLGLAAGAERDAYVISARASSMGISPVLQVAEGRGRAWGLPVQLESGWSSMPGDAPAIAVEQLGGAVAAWSGWKRPVGTLSGGVSSTTDIWMARQGADGTWGAAVRIDDGPEGTTQLSPAIALLGGGRVAAVWEDRRTADGDIYFAEVTGASKPGSSRRLNDDTRTAPQSAPAIAADAEGNVEVLWVDWRSGSPEIYAARRSRGGSWEPNERVAAAGLDVHGAPSVTAAANGDMLAAWIAYPACSRAEGEVGALMVARRPKAGHWLAPVMLRGSVAGGKESRPVIMTDGSGRIYVAWEERSDGGTSVYLSTPAPGGSWTAPRLVGEAMQGRLTKPALAVDASGRVYVASPANDGATVRVAVFEPEQ